LVQIGFNKKIELTVVGFVYSNKFVLVVLWTSNFACV